jgi:3-deoxy-D-manno-octulosonic-acid transferase
MILPLYSLVLIGAQGFLKRKLRRRGAMEPGYLEHIEERFGRYRGTAEPGRLWIHAVSLGETRAAAVLIEELRRQQPDLAIVLTHGTATGRAEGQKLLRDGDVQAWLPWDTPQAVERFLNHFRPRMGVLMETEVWPNLVAACKARGLPLALANARLSEKSLRQARWLAWLSRPAYAALTAVWAQSDADAQRLAQAGATVKGVYGNLKFDAAVDAVQLEQGRRWAAHGNAPVIMFASSREGEEAELFRILAANRAAARSGKAQQATDFVAEAVQWLVVPRHPQRFDEVTALAQQAGFSVSCRSSWVGGPGQAEVWIGDSLGEMPLYYGLSVVALLGGSFAPLGGQNLIEAAACACPVVMGPHTFNFSETAQLAQEAGAALRAGSMDQGVELAFEIANDMHQRGAIAQAAEHFAAAHRGAARKTAQVILTFAVELRSAAD